MFPIRIGYAPGPFPGPIPTQNQGVPNNDARDNDAIMFDKIEEIREAPYARKPHILKMMWQEVTGRLIYGSYFQMAMCCSHILLDAKRLGPKYYLQSGEVLDLVKALAAWDRSDLLDYSLGKDTLTQEQFLELQSQMKTFIGHVRRGNIVVPRYIAMRSPGALGVHTQKDISDNIPLNDCIERRSYVDVLYKGRLELEELIDGFITDIIGDQSRLFKEVIQSLPKQLKTQSEGCKALYLPAVSLWRAANDEIGRLSGVEKTRAINNRNRVVNEQLDILFSKLIPPTGSEYNKRLLSETIGWDLFIFILTTGKGGWLMLSDTIFELVCRGAVRAYLGLLGQVEHARVKWIEVDGKSLACFGDKKYDSYLKLVTDPHPDKAVVSIRRVFFNDGWRPSLPWFNQYTDEQLSKALATQIEVLTCDGFKPGQVMREADNPLALNDLK